MVLAANQCVADKAIAPTIIKNVLEATAGTNLSVAQSTMSVPLMKETPVHRFIADSKSDVRKDVSVFSPAPRP
jgi:hypothetical protein